MSASDNRSSKEDRFKFLTFTLLSGTIAYQGAGASLNGSGKVRPTRDASAATDFHIGTFLEKVDASAADKEVVIDLVEEVVVRWWKNSGTDIVSTDIGKIAYFADDESVSINPTGRIPAGRIWKVDSIKGVAVEKLRSPAPNRAALPTLPAFAAGDTAPAQIVHGAVYDVPATAANSTISLPAAAADGTVAYFHADGTKNGHTLTFRDVATAISAATTAAKRVAATAIKADGSWCVHLTVGP